MITADPGPLRSFVNQHFLALEPVVIHNDKLFSPSEQTDDGVALVTAQGRTYPMREVCLQETLDNMFVRSNRAIVARRIRRALTRLREDCVLDDLHYFDETLVPAFRTRDWPEQIELDSLPGLFDSEPAPEPAPASDLDMAIDARAGELPRLVLPSPSLLVLGRLRLLGRGSRGEPGDHIRIGRNTILVPTGELIFARHLNGRWEQAVDRFAADAAAQLAREMGDPATSPATAVARQELAATGCVQRGDLLFLAGTPPYLGHVIRRHYNKVLGRTCDRDLAVTTPLTRPFFNPTFEVWVRNQLGRWMRVHLAHGLCPGTGLPADRPESPGIGLLAHLRWAANRFASNGAFHVGDTQANG
jgi:hypothetical protein